MGLVVYWCVVEVMEAIRRVLLCIPEAVQGGIGLLEVEVTKVMRCMLLCMLEAVEFSKFAGGDGGDASCAALEVVEFSKFARGDGRDAPCTALYTGGCGG